MKKTTTANIGGLVFHIDLDAYDKLNKYLDEISRYFNDSESRKEIISDIEARIAELLKEKIATETQVITIDEVVEIIKIMGEPEEFAQDQNESSSESQRNTDRRRKVYRDPDNKMLAGVCSGIAYYFGVDPVWIRLFFVIAFLGWGSGIILYLILYAVIPEAKTTAEKLEMKGEPINADNIGKIIDKELKNVKDRIDDFAKSDHAKNSKKAVNSFTEAVEKLFSFLINLIESIFHFLGKFFSLLFSGLGKIIGVGFILFGTILLVIILAILLNSSSLLSMTSDGFHYYSLHQFFGYISNYEAHWYMLVAAIILFIGVPVLAFVYGGFKLLFPSNKTWGNKSMGILFFGLWIIGLVITIILGFQVGMEFKKQARVLDKEINIPVKPSVLFVDLQGSYFDDALDETFDDKYSYSYTRKGKSYELLRMGTLLFQENGNDVFLGIPRLNILKSEDDKMRMRIKKYSNGMTTKEAERRARSIQYHYVLKDSLLVLNPAFEITSEDMLFRDQSVRIDLFIPENGIIDLSLSSERLIYNLSNISESWMNRAYHNWDWNMGGNKWIMTENGLVCISCNEDDLEQLDSLQIELINTLNLNK